MERPFKNKIYFIFRRNLTEPELKGQGRSIEAIRRVLITGREIKRLVNILNPKRLVNLRTRLTMRYAFAKLNFGSELKELIDKILDIDFLPMAIECYGETKKASIAMTALDDTLAALSLFRMKNEATLLMEYCITGRIKRYMQHEKIIKIFRRWNPSMGTFSDDSMDIRWLVGFVLLGLMGVSATFGAVSLMTSAVIFIAMLMIGAKQMSSTIMG